MFFFKIFFLCFIRNELAIIKKRIKVLLIFFNKKNLFKKNKNFKEFLKKNKNFWVKNNIIKGKVKFILITNIANHPAYTTSEIAIGKSLMEVYNCNGAALLEPFDIKNKLLFESYGIKKIFFIGDLNIFLRFKYFIKSFNILNNINDIDELLSLRIDNIDYGKSIYDHSVRFSGMGTIDKILDVFYFHFLRSFIFNNQIDNILKSNNIVATVQSERIFLPGSILYQSSLVNKKNVYSRIGVSNNICVTKYNDINDRYRCRYTVSKKLFDEVKNKLGKKAIIEGGKIIEDRFKGINEKQALHEFYDGPKFRKEKIHKPINKRHFTKDELCKQLGWEINKPINVIFSTDLTDGIFDQRWSLFRDRLTMIIETLKIARNVTNVNWLIKPHPNDLLHRVVTTTASVFNKICKNYNHMKMLPEELTMSSLPKIANLAITTNGSVASEYPAFGVPSVISAEAICSNLGFTIEPKNIAEYSHLLRNSDKLKKLDSSTIDNAKIYAYLYINLLGVKTKMIPENDSRDFNEMNFWDEMSILIENYKPDEELLTEMMQIQHEKNDRHAIDYRLLKI